jgi:hypothetical protein
MTIGDLIDSVRVGVWRESVERVRAELDKDIRRTLKENLIPAVTISGVTDKREKGTKIQHNGFMAIDIDNVDSTNGVEKDQYTYACAKSVSGTGYFLIIKVNKERHLDSFRNMRDYYFKEYGLVIDEAPKNPASLRYVSYDPNIVVNEKSKTAPYKENKPKKVKGLPLVVSGEEIDNLITLCVQNNANICESYEEYRNVGFALADKMGENGRHHFHTLASMSAKYKAKEADRQYSACLSGGNDGITINTLYWMFQQNGIELPKQDKAKIAFCNARLSKGATKENVTEELVELHGLSKDKAEAMVEAVGDSPTIDYEEMGEDLRSIIDTFPVWVKENYPIYRNEITGHYMHNGNNLTGGILNKIITHAKRDYNSSILKTSLITELLITDNMPVVNPLKESLKKEVAYTDELERLCASVETSSPLGHIFIRKWMISLMYALHGEPIRLVLTLTGGQETGKTHWFRHLLPEWAMPYYAQSKLTKGKDDDILMTEKWVILDDEGGGKSKKDAQNFKELTSTDVFNLRKPYDKENGSYKRLAVLCVTTNETQIINDPTGNTRILPVEVLDINRDLYNNIDRDALFSQLYALYKSGEKWQLTSDEKKTLQNDFDIFETDKPERDLILTYFREPTEGERYDARTSSEIKAYIEKQSDFKFKSDQRFFSELNRLFKDSKKSTARGTKRMYCYHLAERMENIKCRL